MMLSQDIVAEKDAYDFEIRRMQREEALLKALSSQHHQSKDMLSAHPSYKQNPLLLESESESKTTYIEGTLSKK